MCVCVCVCVCMCVCVCACACVRACVDVKFSDISVQPREAMKSLSIVIFYVEMFEQELLISYSSW